MTQPSEVFDLSTYRENEKEHQKQLARLKLARFIPIIDLKDSHPSNKIIQAIDNIYFTQTDPLCVYIDCGIKGYEQLLWLLENCSVQFGYTSQEEFEITDYYPLHLLNVAPEILETTKEECSEVFIRIPENIQREQLFSIHFKANSQDLFYHRFRREFFDEYGPQKYQGESMTTTPDNKNDSLLNKEDREANKQERLDRIYESLVNQIRYPYSLHLDPNHPDHLEYVSKMRKVHEDQVRAVDRYDMIHNPFKFIKERNPNSAIFKAIKDIREVSNLFQKIKFADLESKKWFLENVSISFTFFKNKKRTISPPLWAMSLNRHQDDYHNENLKLEFSYPYTAPPQSTEDKPVSMILLSSDGEVQEYVYYDPFGLTQESKWKK